MPRIAGAVGAVSLALMAGGAFAIDEKQKETCQITSDIVGSSVIQRADGADVNAVKDIFMTGDSAVEEKYQPTVGPLVDWVFSLEQAVIEEADAPDIIAARYQESCLGYKP